MHAQDPWHDLSESVELLRNIFRRTGIKKEGTGALETRGLIWLVSGAAHELTGQQMETNLSSSDPDTSVTTLSIAVVRLYQETTIYTAGTLPSADVLSLLSFLTGITVLGKAIS